MISFDDPPSIKCNALFYSILLILQPVLSTYASEYTINESYIDQNAMTVTSGNTALKINTPAIEAPRSVSEVTRENIQDRSSKKLDEAMRYSAGVFATPYGPDNKTDWLIIRGFGWSRYQDSLQTLNENGFYGWQQEIYGVERINMLKGPASMLYGQNPPGGLVNVISKRPTRLPQNEIELSYGSNEYRHFAVDSSGPLDEHGDILYRVVGLAKQTNGVIDGSESERFYLAPSLTFNLSYDTTLTLLTSYTKDNTNPTSGFKLPYGTLQDTPFGKVNYKMTYGEPNYSKNNTEQFSIGYELEHHFNETWSFHQNISYNYLHMDLRSVYALGMLDERHVNRGLTYRNGSAQSWAIDNRMTANWLLDENENTLLLGIDYFTANSRGKDANLYSFGDPLDIFDPVYGHYPELTDDELFSHRTNRQQTGLYLQNQFKFTDQWLLLVGGRYDKARSNDIQPDTNSKLSMNDSKFTKTAGLMYLAKEGVHPYISYAESFQPLSGRDNNNNAYKPQTGKQTEIGIKYQPTGFNGYLNTAIYELYQQNTLTTDPNNPAIRAQTGEARARGIELEAIGKLANNLTFISSYTFSKVETTRSLDQSVVNKRLPATAKNIASIWLDYHFDHQLDGLTIGSGVRYIGSSYGDNVNSRSLKVPAYTLFDAMIRYDINKQWQVQFNASNLSNKKYVSACDFWCYYGDGRTISAKINYRW